MIALDERDDENLGDMKIVGKLATELGVELQETSKPEAPAAVGIWLFDGSAKKLPGGYDTGELSANSPVKELKSFPQELVLVGRSSILIKALSNRLQVPWSLASEWAPIARQVLEQNYQPGAAAKSIEGKTARTRFREVWTIFKMWTKGRASRVVRKLPPPIRSQVALIALKYQERKARRDVTTRQKK